MKVIKRNQIIVSVIALMLITAGYLSYTSDNQTNNNNFIPTSSITGEDPSYYAGIGDATLVNSNNIEEQSDTNETANTNTNETTSNNMTEEKAAEVNAAVAKDDYFVTSRLGRDTMYSQMIESYQKILESSTISAEQKGLATQEIANINNTKNAIMISENLIKTKGIDEVIIFVNDKSISVIVKATDLTEEKIAQIQNIIAREMKAEIENIHISAK